MPFRVDPNPTPAWRCQATLGLLALLGGCTTTIDFDSQPRGATVTYRGQTLGVTPFRAGVHDEFGWFSRYEFTASKAGYRSHTLRFDERTPLDHNNVLPLRMDFQLPPP
jgi:hypothetical protein